MTDKMREAFEIGQRERAVIAGLGLPRGHTFRIPTRQLSARQPARVDVRLSARLGTGGKMNPMQNKTPEERKAIAAKAHATRRARRDAEDAARQDALKYAGGLRRQIAELEERLAALQRMETMNSVSAAVTGSALLREDEIAKAALPWAKASGVYFLLDGDEVVYVGQAVNVYSRIGQHTGKRFDRYAFVPCAVDALDRLESLYIHCLRPRLNGNQRNDAKCAPIALDALIGMTPNG